MDRFRKHTRGGAARYVYVPFGIRLQEELR